MSPRIVFVAALLAAPGAGCLGKRFVMEPARLYPPESIITNGYQPRDVPVPRGFRYLPKESFAYVGAFRVAELHYEGEGLVEEVAAFLDDQLPRHGWSPMRREGVEAITLVYVNPRAECRLSIRRIGSQTHLRVHLIPRDVKPQGL